MKFTYTIQVCNESRELFSLLNFLIKVKDDEDNINVVVDSLHKTDKVLLVLDHFKDKVSVYHRPFDNFHDNATYHGTVATGDYIFGLDADEMPQEDLIKGIKKILTENDIDIVWIPRINIHPGLTKEFLEKYKFPVNENNWINWPDYQGRIYKRNDKIRWTNEMHTKLVGGERNAKLPADPRIALWHIKSVEKQDTRWEHDAIQPPGKTLYEQLM
jgi:hypothetical protein